MNKSFKPNPAQLRLWAYVLCGAAFGLSYGMLTSAGEVMAGCFRDPEDFCGFISAILNLPITLLNAHFLSRDGLYTPLLQLTNILMINALLGAFIGYIAAKTVRKNPALKFGISLFVFALIFAMPLILFIMFSS